MLPAKLSTADRFKMATHTETRPVSAYTLVAVKPKLTKADPSNRTRCKEGPAPAAKDIEKIDFVEACRKRFAPPADNNADKHDSDRPRDASVGKVRLRERAELGDLNHRHVQHHRRGLAPEFRSRVDVVARRHGRLHAHQ